MIVRVDDVVDPAGTTEQIGGAVGDPLIGVHVGCGSAATLHDVEGKVLVELVRRHFPRRLQDHTCEVAGNFAELLIGPDRGGLYLPERGDQLRSIGERQPGDPEVATTALSLSAVQCGLRHRDRAKRVSLDPRRSFTVATLHARSRHRFLGFAVGAFTDP